VTSSSDRRWHTGIAGSSDQFERLSNLVHPRLGFFAAADQFVDIENEPDRILRHVDWTGQDQVATCRHHCIGEPVVGQIESARPLSQRDPAAAHDIGTGQRSQICSVAVDGVRDRPVGDRHTNRRAMGNRQRDRASREFDALQRHVSRRALGEHRQARESNSKRQRGVILDLDDRQPAAIGHRPDPLHGIAIGDPDTSFGDRRSGEADLTDSSFGRRRMPSVVSCDVPIDAFHGAARLGPRGDRAPP
jgi:hypothetical protein